MKLAIIGPGLIGRSITLAARRASPDAEIVVQIQDVTLENVIGTPIGEARVSAADIVAGRATFSITYDPALIIETNRYVVVGRIDTADAQTILVSIEPVLVLTGGNPTEGIEVVLTPIGVLPATPLPVASVARPSPAPTG